MGHQDTFVLSVCEITAPQTSIRDVQTDRLDAVKLSEEPS